MWLNSDRISQHLTLMLTGARGRADSGTQLREQPSPDNDSIIRNISSRDTTTCCLPQATVSDVNRELQNILTKHKTANRVIIHVGKNDIHKEQSELLKRDFNELFETLRRVKVKESLFQDLAQI